MSDLFDFSDDDMSAIPLSRQAAPRPALSSEITSMLDALNEEQHAAVTAPDGPLLLLAGAGTGKTRALTTRIAYKLITGQAQAGQILAVTFTNKAAREMKERISTLVGQHIENAAWLGTFHSLSTRILRRHAELVDLRPDFTILDTDDQIRLLKQIIRSHNIDEKRWPARQMANLIDKWKNRGWAPDRVPDTQAALFAHNAGKDIYTSYQAQLKILNAADFGDLLLESLRLFQENEDILQYYQNRFQHILVDEYQDTNNVQYLWLRLLAQAHNNICCVGDDDQSIYGWRGAEVKNILQFEKDFPGAQIIRLECNYRSTPHILGAASGLIAANKSRLGKTLWTNRNDACEKVRLRGIWDSQEEARLIAEACEDFQRKGETLNEIAILVRASFQMREFEDKFIEMAIPYRVIGGPRFYERAEIRDANAYFRLIAQADDNLAFERIINKPRRGLGKVALQTLHKVARDQHISLYRAAQQLTQSDMLKPAARRALTSFVAMVERWRNVAQELPLMPFAECVLDESGYTAMWQAEKTADAPGKLENLKELVRTMDDYDNLTAYLEHIALVMDAEHERAENKISLMTLHASKGLEFNIVFLPGWEEGLFPHQRSLDEGQGGLEEERRLAYVGITRAKNFASISFVGNRKTHGQWTASVPSRFIDELPQEHIEVDMHHTQQTHTPQSRFAHDYKTTQFTDQNRRAYKTPKTIDAKVSHHTPHDTSSVASAFHQKERIFHQKFGYGHIMAIDGKKLTVQFEKAGVKKIIDEFAEKLAKHV